MYWLVSLIICRAFFAWMPIQGWGSLILDINLIGSVFFLIKKNQVARALQAWRFLRFQKQKDTRRDFNLAVASDVIKAVSLPFVALWFMRWFDTWPEIFARAPSAREYAYLDVFIFSLILSLILDTQRLRRLLMHAQMTTGRQMLLHYGIAILVGTLLLVLPMSLQDKQSLSLMNSLFVTVSALSVTGLTPVDVGATLSMTGQAILLVLIQLGGLGIVLITTGFSVATFNRLSLNSILLGREMYGSCRVGEIPDFLARVVGLTAVVEIVGAIFLYFSLPVDTPYRVFTALFHSISAFCNAGFSTFAFGLNQPVFNGFGIFTVCVLVILGGFGFPILLDMIASIRRREPGLRFLSSHGRLTLTVMAVLLILGPILFFVLETLRPSADLSVWHRIGQSLFYSISSRTAGFNMLPVENFHMSALFWLVLLMVIGANPASTGGGIKTTTVGVLLVAVYHTIRGTRQTVYKGRAIPTSTIARALTVVTLYTLVAGASFILLVIIESAPPFALGFEVISALSTVGLSMGITPHLTAPGKIVLMFLMLFGRIGILGIVLAGMGNVSRTRVRYPDDDFFVG